jgi:hypothetical protein
MNKMYKLLHTVYSEYVMDDMMEMKMSEVDGACNRNLLHIKKRFAMGSVELRAPHAANIKSL